MGVDHGRRHIPVTQQLLDGPGVIAVFKQMGCGRVAKGVAACRLWNTRLASLILVLSFKPTYSEGTEASQETLG